MRRLLWLFTAYLLTVPMSLAGSVTKDYSQLKLLDLEEMNSLINDYVSRSRQAKNRERYLLEGITLLMSRPDEDGLRRKVMPNLRSEAEVVMGWSEALYQIANESLLALKEGTKDKAAIQVTNAIILENILSEIKPVISSSDDFLKIAKLIAKANVQISEEAKAEREMRVMQVKKSPSEIAQELIDSLATKPKAKK